MAVAPFFARFAEWQCVNPKKPVPEGGEHSNLWDEGISNGWFPEITLFHDGDTLRITHHGTSEVIHCYERFVPGQANSHNSETCTACRARAAMEKEREEEDMRLSPQPDGGAANTAVGATSDSTSTPSSPEASPALSHESGAPLDLPRPENPLDHILHEVVQPSDGQDVGSARIMETEAQEHVQVTDVAGVVAMNVGDSDSEGEEVQGEVLEDDFSPFDTDSCAGVRDIIITGEVRLFRSLPPDCEPDLLLERRFHGMQRHGTITSSTAVCASLTV